MSSDPSAALDSRFSDAAAGPTPWSDVARALERAELYWLTTVRVDGRPHVTPLIGLGEGEIVYFCTGLREQKARNLEHNGAVALVVVEGSAVRVSDQNSLRRLADAYESKYGSAWHFEVGDGVFGAGEDAAAVFRIEPDKVLAFAKQPHAQTTYRFSR